MYVLLLLLLVEVGWVVAVAEVLQIRQMWLIVRLLLDLWQVGGGGCAGAAEALLLLRMVVHVDR